MILLIRFISPEQGLGADSNNIQIIMPLQGLFYERTAFGRLFKKKNTIRRQR